MWISEGYLKACPLVVFHLSLGLVPDPCQGTLQRNLISENHGFTVAGKATERDKMMGKKKRSIRSPLQ